MEMKFYLRNRDEMTKSIYHYHTVLWKEIYLPINLQF